MKYIATTPFCFILFLFQVESVHAQKNEVRMVEVGSGIRTLHSDIVGQDYDLYLSLPRNYDDPENTRTYPVLYLLDAQYDFANVVSGYWNQFYDGFAPGLIIVGITWAGEEADAEFLRGRDFTPTNQKGMAHSGNAPKFLSFIKNELAPFIEKEYRADPDNRALAGSSLGGLFTMYAMFHETNFFNSYVISSPAIGWDDGLLFSQEKEYSQTHSDLDAKVYMVIGEYENTSEFQRMTDLIESRNYPNLIFKSRVLDGMAHAGSKSEAYARALGYLYERPSLILPDEVLKEYAGNYEFSSGEKAELFLKGGYVYVKDGDGNTDTQLHAMKKDELYVLGAFLYLHMKRDETGKLTGFDLEDFNGSGGFVRKVN